LKSLKSHFIEKKRFFEASTMKAEKSEKSPAKKAKKGPRAIKKEKMEKTLTKKAIKTETLEETPTKKEKTPKIKMETPEKTPTKEEKTPKIKKETSETKPTTKKETKGPRLSKEEKWATHFEECQQYREKNGHCKIPTSYKENKSLGNWVQELRRNYKLQKQGMKPRVELTEEQIEQLDELGFHWGFTPDPMKTAEPDASWEANFEKLKDYMDSHGDVDVPMESGTLQLATWARVQRYQNNCRVKKTKSFMSMKRFKKLDGIDFDWEGPRTLD